jgi:hypothetical protein
MLEFEARKGAKCGACAFNGQWARVCAIAASEAVKRGLKDCDDGVVYVLVRKDPRQLDVLSNNNY